MAAPQFDLYDSFSWEGLWWTPGNQETNVAGTITFSPTEGVVLSLLGTLRDMPMAFGSAMGSECQEVVHGITAQGIRITLYDCYVSQFQLNAPGISTEKYKVLWMLVGDFLPSLKEVIFNGCSIRFEKLEEWIGHRNISENVDSESRRMVIAFLPPDQKEMRCESIGSAVVEGWSYEVGGDRVRGVELKTSSYLEIRSDTPIDLRSMVDRAFRLRNLAAICFGHPLSVLSIDLLGEMEEIIPEHFERQKFRVFFQQPQHARQRAADNKIEMPIISATELQNSASDAFSNWFRVYDEIKPAMDLFFTVLLNRTLYSDVAFLLTSQAIEVLHRLTSEEGLVEQMEFEAVTKALKEAMPSDTPKKLREKINGMLLFANEPSLRQRLKQSVGELKEDFGDSPLGVSKKMVEDIVNTRNYLTHYPPDLAGRTLTGADLYHATRRMVALLLVLLMARIGVPMSRIRASLSRHHEFREYVA